MFDGKSVNNFSQSGPESTFFRLWNWALPLLLGLAAGWFAMVCLEIWLEGRNLHSRPITTTYDFTPHAPEAGIDKMEAFLRANPFGVTPMPIPGIVPEFVPAVQTVESLASAILTGTSPGHMAWMRHRERLRLILIGSQFYSYTLVEVTHVDATFINGDHVVKHLIFGNRQAQPPQHFQPSTAAPSEIMHSDPMVSTTGQISRELVNQLLENPFDELREIRLRPSDDGQGLQVEWITGDSILAQLGVQQGDIVRSINGIVFLNAMDIVNSLNSLMDSDQFIVEMTRHGAPTLLQYVVR